MGAAIQGRRRPRPVRRRRPASSTAASPPTRPSAPFRAPPTHLGRTARRNDVRTGRGPSLPAELRTLVGCVWHTGRRRCANGIVMAAHSLGRVRETLAEGRP